MSRLRVVGLFAVLALTLALVPTVGTAATPSDGKVSPDSPAVEWQGKDFAGPNLFGTCIEDSDPFCDVFELDVQPGGQRSALDIVTTADASGDSYALYVYGPDGEEVGRSMTIGTTDEVTLQQPAPGVYRIEVQPILATPGASYSGVATLREIAEIPSAASGPNDSVLFDVDPDAPVASAKVPLRVVAVGFEPGELDAAAVLGEIPDRMRPGTLFQYGGGFRSGDVTDLFGVDTLVNHGRAYYESNEPPLLPIEFEWQPELHYAPEAFTDGLFAHMVASSHTGRYDNDNQTAFLEAYNVSRGTPYRTATGGSPVPPGSEVLFVDGETTEDWIAANSRRHLGFTAGKNPREPGYTVFLLNTYDSPQARKHFPDDRYHNFFIDRPDPDTGEFSGIDWARIWGGRYRFMMVDLGAAPNAYEAETWGNRNRSLFGSAGYDPPLWEYRANAPRPLSPVHLADGWEQAISPGESWDAEQMNFMMGRTVNQAMSFRFLHAYLYEPRPGTGRFWLSDNVWHDANAEVPFATDLEALYDQEMALEGLRSLTPYFEFDGDVQFQYLSQTDEHPEYAEDQAALDAAKQGGDDVAGAPHVSMRTEVMMDYIDSKPDRFLRGGDCYTTVPTIQVVVPGHYAWALPVAAGIATNRDGVPWGFLNSVNDITKWSGADRDETMSHAHPQPLGGGTFTYVTIHEASHYLGLAHPHDTVGATRNPDGSPRYYDGFTWAFNSTASPTTYSHAEIVYSILDQESIARGHLSYYLEWANEALHEAGGVYDARGTKTLGQLPEDARALRAEAITSMRRAQRLFGEFDFVAATFAAQRSWKAAAAYHDLAFGKAPGTAELARGTKQVTGEAAAACVAGDRIERIAGRDRVETAVAVSRRAFDSAETVLLARSDLYPDALAGAPLAADRQGPILLTHTNVLPGATAEELGRLGTRKVVLLGGSAAIGPEVEAQLSARRIEIERVSGPNRFATAAAVADAIGGGDGVAYVSVGAHADPGRGWPDALSVAPVAAHTGRPILLVIGDYLPPETAAALQRHDVREAVVVGGSAAVDNAVFRQLGRAGHAPRRVAGPTRYDTSAAVHAEGASAGLGSSAIWLATGRNWPDALTAGPAVAALGESLVLIDGQSLESSPATYQLLQDRAASLRAIRLIGGSAAVSDLVHEQVQRLLEVR